MSARLGLVSYLNSRPIGWGLTHGRQRGRFEIVEDVPSALAEHLWRGAIDLALLPTVEYARARLAGRELAIVPGIAIASRGAAESVLLFSRVPLDRIRSLAVDLSSRTSVALVRLLMRRRLAPRAPEPELVSAPPDLRTMLDRSEAALVIGDAALLASRSEPGLVSRLTVIDLGTEWEAMTRLPFVYAVWAGPRREDSFEIVRALQDSLAEGLESIAEIARIHSEGDEALEELLARYLTRSIRFELGRDEIAGLTCFFRLLREEHLLPGQDVDLVFQEAAPGAEVRKPIGGGEGS